jgi:tetratricopeptide (TPR) repeat protein
MRSVRHAVSALALLGGSLATASSARALGRTAADANEVAILRQRSPQAAELLERGEARALAGAIDEADALFKQGEVAYPNGSILWRRDCEMLSALGRREEAVHACNVATESSRSLENLRAVVRALVTGPEPPKSMDLFVALTLEDSQRRKSQGQAPVLAAIDCDIAESVGDGTMLQECTKELETLAPNSPDTQRALALLAGRCPPWRFWTGWTLIAGAAVGTAWHAAAGSRRRRRLAGPIAAGAIVLAALSSPAGVARAQGADPAAQPAIPSGWLSKWPVNDDDPASSIPSSKERDADPLQFGYWIQDLIMKAEHASKRGDHAQSAKFWSALEVAVPDRAVSFTKACDEYEAAGDTDKAIDACGQALLRDGLTVKDYTHFVHVVIDKPGPISPKETAALGQVLDHMKADDAGRAAAVELECEVGVRTSNVRQLKECTTALTATAPDDAKTISYRWALAVLENRFTEARTLIAQAKAKGVEGPGLDNMERTTSEGARHYWTRLALWLACFALILGATGLAGRALASRRRAPQLA